MAGVDGPTSPPLNCHTRILAYASLIDLFGSVADVVVPNNNATVEVVLRRWSPHPPPLGDNDHQPRARDTIPYVVSLTSCCDTGGGMIF